ncbi:Bax inhibitor-1 family protein [Sphingomonas canadensis]|uniref:Bax inhibitor-1 family protein n=1 Tax=Sphingomonas canadensis TaxID=1219257 RepID=A0ABW3HDR9_9SPHN|nr:Bax inhibitor-1 family protein [Sphingomonas canadensis]MCW3837334.1 Bax inhibitor-1 family protein [Sphingomonas canadensis]
MADWSDPQTSAPYARGSAAQAAAYDAGLRAHMLGVYNYMLSGVLLTGIISLVMWQTGFVEALLRFNYAGEPVGMSGLGWIVALSPLAIVLAMSFGQMRLSTGTMQVLFFLYAGLMGASLSTIFLAYTAGSIAQVFFATAAGFAGLGCIDIQRISKGRDV